MAHDPRRAARAGQVTGTPGRPGHLAGLPCPSHRRRLFVDTLLAHEAEAAAERESVRVSKA
ncbi:hypothetical protein ABZ137_01275 [Streptomyces bobili]|uniref:hypothetical protein n=1 Tax=Streptomyces bobili TaxID=67280 RepID=UPI0033BF85E2